MSHTGAEKKYCKGLNGYWILFYAERMFLKRTVFSEAINCNVYMQIHFLLFFSLQPFYGCMYITIVDTVIVIRLIVMDQLQAALM